MTGVLTRCLQRKVSYHWQTGVTKIFGQTEPTLLIYLDLVKKCWEKSYFDLDWKYALVIAYGALLHWSDLMTLIEGEGEITEVAAG